jgi:hypothetical protein
MAGSTEQLESLHEKLANEFNERISKGEVVLGKKGEAVEVGCSSATLNAARQFLKDNGIVVKSGASSKLEELASHLQIAPIDEEGDDAATA